MPMKMVLFGETFATSQSANYINAPSCTSLGSQGKQTRYHQPKQLQTFCWLQSKSNHRLVQIDVRKSRRDLGLACVVHLPRRYGIESTWS